jgi:hypothetical protein
VSYDGPVLRSPELERVLGLPQREIDFDSPVLRDLALAWSRQLLNDAGKRELERVLGLPEAKRRAELDRFAQPRNKGGEGCPLIMSSAQAVILYEALGPEHMPSKACAGVFASAGVGIGKTLCTYALSLVLGAARPVLLVPGAAREPTDVKFADLARYWLAPRPMPQVVSYQLLSSPTSGPDLLDKLQPDLIIADEAHKLKNPRTGATKRVGRYMARHPSTTFCAMTGTAWRKSIRNSAHLIIWALKHGAPVPLTYIDLIEWCEALDLKDGKPRDPGALLEFCERPSHFSTYMERLAAAGEGFKRRLLLTPGFIQTDTHSCDQPLHIRFQKAPDDPILDAEFYRFRSSDATRDGWDVSDGLSRLRHGEEISCGFFYKWVPRPPQEYIDARHDAMVAVREYIKASARTLMPLDTMAQVYQFHGDDPVLRKWQEIENDPNGFKPNTVAEPITASVLGYAAAWLRANGPALVWVRHEYVGQALSGMTGIPYFAAGGKDAHGRHILKHDPRKSAILSLRANMLELNLQAWNRNLVICPPPDAPSWEQGICGRTHRQGQDKPVFVDVLIASAENLHAIEAAHEEATWGEKTTGQPQKLLIAHYDWAHFPVAELRSLPLNHPSRSRWND